MPDLGPCEKSFKQVSKEALLRDFASRAFYTAFLKLRNELEIPDAMHETVQAQLASKYKNMFRDMKAFRVTADYHTDVPLASPLKSVKSGQYYPQRLLTTMNILLAATAEQLAANHETLKANRERNT